MQVRGVLMTFFVFLHLDHSGNQTWMGRSSKKEPEIIPHAYFDR